MEAFLERMNAMTVGYLPRLLLALLVLVAGWLLARLIAGLVRSALKRTKFDNRLASWVGGDGSQIDVERIAGRVVFWLLFIFVLVAFFSILGLTIVTGPLNGFLEEIFAFLPRLLSAAALALVAWLVATGLRFAVTKALAATSLDRRLADEVSSDTSTSVTTTSATTTPARTESAAVSRSATPGAATTSPTTKKTTVRPSKTIGDTVYWLVFLFFLPAILDALALEGLLGPVNELLNRVMGFLPNLLSAALILGIGWLVAQIIRRVVSNLLAAAGADRLGERVGLTKVTGERRLSTLLSLVVYVLVLVPVVIAALEALKIESITVPASQMLNRVLAAIPQIFAAAVILLVAYFVGKLVSELVAALLAGIGFDRLMDRIGFTRSRPAIDPAAPAPAIGDAAIGDPAVGRAPVTRRSPSEIVGFLVMAGVMLFATIEALEALQFESLAAVVTQFTYFAGDVLLGVVIFAIGLYLANFAAGAVRSSDVENSDLLALFAKGAILVLAGAMALRQAGLAEDIINLAFGLILGAVAIATAIAFGIGGRDVAGRYLERWTNRLDRRDGSTGATPPPTGTTPPRTLG